VFKRLGELGLLGLTKPTDYGGMALDYSYSVIMAETLGHVNCGRDPDGDRRADRHVHTRPRPLRLRRA
jgi:hypothetical protein